MKKYASAFVVGLFLATAVVQAVPQMVKAEESKEFKIIVDCKYGHPDPKTGKPIPIFGSNPPEYECGFLDVVAQIQKLITFAFMAVVPILIITLTWSGIQMLIFQSNTSELKKAKDRIQYILLGMILVLGAWLIVHVIASNLLEKPFYEPFLGE